MNVVKLILFAINILFGILYIAFALSKVSKNCGKAFAWIAGLVSIANAAFFI